MSQKTFKLPKSLGACADRLYVLRAERLKLQKRVEEYKEESIALQEHLIKLLPKSQASGVAGKIARAQVGSVEVPQVEDWGKFYDYVRKGKHFDLMQKRLSTAAIEERWEEGVEVPGVVHFKTKTISVTKV